MVRYGTEFGPTNTALFAARRCDSDATASRARTSLKKPGATIRALPPPRRTFRKLRSEMYLAFRDLGRGRTEGL
jgi:hypothetical protein